MSFSLVYEPSFDGSYYIPNHLQITSSLLLCQAIEEMFKHLQDHKYIRLINCFLNPKYMLDCAETPSSPTHQQLLELGLANEEEPVDQLYNLFNSDHSGNYHNTLPFCMHLHMLLDQFSQDLVHSLAGLVAVIVGKPSQSNHLWYHLFAPGQLEDSYITGFMVFFPIHRHQELHFCTILYI